MKRSVRALGAISLAAAVLAGIGGAGMAIAQQRMGGMGGHDPFGQATIARAEAQTRAGEMFARLDANGDGKLDPADRAAAMGKRFDAMDANRDGVLSKQEFLDAHQKMMGRREGPGGPGAHRMGPGKDNAMGGQMAGRMNGMRAMGGMMMLHRMDANGDKAISRDEFLAGALKRFDAADANHDGKLTPEERRATMRQMMMKHRQMMGQMMGQPGGPGMGHNMGDMPPPPSAK